MFVGKQIGYVRTYVATVFLYCNSRYKVIVNVLSRMGKWERKERRGTP